MANTKLTFLGTERSETDDVELQCYKNGKEEIYISLSDYANNDYTHICLDKPTAIKLHRELKKQISYIEEGTHNG